MNEQVNFLYFGLCLAWMSSLFVLLLFITMFCIYEQFYSSSSHKYRLNFISLTSTDDTYINSIIIILCLIGSGLDLSHIIIHLIENHNFSWNIEPIVAGFADILYFLAQITFYYLLINKLYSVFNKTSLKISIYLLLFLLFLLLLIFICAILHVKMTSFEKGSNDYSKNDNFVIFSLSITDFLLNITLFVLFFYKIRQLIILQKINTNNIAYDFSSGSAGDDCVPALKGLNDINDDASSRLFELISKHSVLFGIALITNQFFYLGVILIELLNIADTNYTTALLITFSARAFENCINGLIVWLTLSKNHKLYRFCCKICHNNTIKCCKFITPQNKIQKQSEYTQSINSYYNEVKFTMKLSNTATK